MSDRTKNIGKEEDKPLKETGESGDAGLLTGFPIVGIGASAGGLAAFESFFSGMPADKDPGMAFVLVQHLAPDHKSMLTDLIRRYTRMKVHEVEDGMEVRPNCTYIIPPNHDMALMNGYLHLLDPAEPRGQRLPIDYFFRSLAKDQRERAIGVVLSGTGSDGTLGVRAIKSEGGMVIAQTPDSTEYDGMPRSAIATGLVDYELPPAEMAGQIISYAAHAYARVQPPAGTPAGKAEGAMKKIFVLLRAQTGHDFSHYKPSTIHRRIERRIAVHQLRTVDEYVSFMQQSPAEVEALFRDLLIGVTRFFRDADVFKALETEVIPKLFAGKPAGSVIRVWIPGCSTGEEAYSVAILMAEQIDQLKQSYLVQIFATDIDSNAIAVARAGIYPAGIAADISAERLARFFSVDSEKSAYRIHKSVRDMLIFSEQDLIKDPPFSKLDFISCRNLLIYLGGELQKKVIPLFHYALRPGGFLLLGSSEGVGDFGDLFDALDRKAKIFRRKEDAHGIPRAAISHFLPPLRAVDVPITERGIRRPAGLAKPPLRELTEQKLLQQAALTGALVNDKGDILYLHGRADLYLEIAPGEMGINNILKMAREGLRSGLVRAFHEATNSREPVHSPLLRVKTEGHFTMVNLTIHPVTSGSAATQESPLFLVVLEESPLAGSEIQVQADAVAPGAETDSLVTALRQELRAKDEHLTRMTEELESSTEELKSSNEEMQSVNEELQSTNEELETSKEELQSVNEELATVNTELHTKVRDLSRAYNDMNNLLAGTGVGTVFVDHQLRILRFTPAATAIINLIEGDVGRPIGHISSNLVGYDSLVADTQSVLDTLVPRDLTVRATSGKWFAMHIQPYRTLDNVIEGAVISFVDVSEIVQTRDKLREANEQLGRLAVVVRDSHAAITVQDLEGRITAWNPAAEKIYGWSEAEALGMNVRERIPADLREESLAWLESLSRSEVLTPFDTRRLTKSGEIMDVTVVSSALLDEHEKIYAIATTERPRLV